MKVFLKPSWTLLTLLLVVLAFSLVFPGVSRAAGVPPVEEVIKGKAKCPTIEDLTDGKVKIGDLIDKNNVDLVKEYLPRSLYEAVKRGMVLRMGRQLPPEELCSKTFRELTEKNRGKAIVDENGIVYYEKKGVYWPGGLPFPEPKNALEVMGNVKYGQAWDDFWNHPIVMTYIDSKGRVYKTVGQEHRYVLCSVRKRIPPLGVAPGYEGILFKRLVITTFPREIKGLGQYSLRYYDDAKHYDTGFAYLPAFKRTIRISATTWYDNVAGSDFTHQDGMGMQDPYSRWKFKLLGIKYMLLTEPKTPFPLVDEKTGFPTKWVKFDVGKKFPRVGWTIYPTYVVEAVPKGYNIYGKKVLYITAWPYWVSICQISVVDIYDRQMKLWKLLAHPMKQAYVKGEAYTMATAIICYDLQADHMTIFWMNEKMDIGIKPEDISLKTLLKYGR